MNQIVAIAESWIGTPFRYGASIKGKGVDCAKFVFMVFKELGAIQTNDLPPHLPPCWNDVVESQGIDPNIFRNQLLKYADIVPFNDRRAGDVISFIYRGLESHVGILVEDDCIVHAKTGRRVVKQRLRSLTNVCSVYRLKK